MAKRTKLEEYQRGFTEREAALSSRERELQTERDGTHRRLAELTEQRREAEVEAELVVIDGQPEPESRQLTELDGEIAKVRDEIQRDRWGSKLEACRRARRKLEEDRERFLDDHRDDILAELVVADVEATERLSEAFEAVIAADTRRRLIGNVMGAVLQKMPPPHDGSSYRLEVRNDRATAGLLAEIRRRSELLDPLAPVELLRDEDEREAEVA